MNTGYTRKSTTFRRPPLLPLLSSLAGIALLLAACTAPAVQVPGTGSSTATGSSAGSNTAAPAATVVSAATSTSTGGSAGAAVTGSPAVASTPMVVTVLPAATSQTAGVGTLTPPANGTTTPTAAAGTPAATGENLTVTLADDGKTIMLKVGQTFLLDLGPDMNWTPNVVNQKIVSRVIGITVIQGAQGVYKADAPGTTQLMANGEPTCRQAKPACAMPNRLFSVTIVVEQ